MTTTPLKTAARVLSLATLIVASFTAWGVSTHALRVPAAAPRFQPLTTANHAPQDIPPARDLDKADAAAPVVKPDAPNANTRRAPVVFKEITPPSVLEAESPAPSRRGHPRIQPELGRQPIALDPPTFDEKLVADEPLAEKPPRTNSSKPHSQPPRQTTPATPLVQTQSSSDTDKTLRMATRLTTLQRQVEQMAQAQIERQTEELEQTTQRLQQAQQQQQVNLLEKQLKELLEKERQRRSELKDLADGLLPGTSKDKATSPDKEPPAESEPAENTEVKVAEPRKSGLLRAEPIEGQSERFSIQFQDAEISEALGMLGQLSGLNILVGRGVAGRVPAVNLQDVTAEQALNAITKSLGYVYERDEHFVYVSTALDAEQRRQALRKTVTKVYRPKYVSVKELQALVTPLMTKGLGLIAVTTPADIGLEMSRTKVGGDSLAQADAVLVVDYPEVVAQIDGVMLEIDVPPAQVVIEAMILSVKLDESMKLGVNFALLNDSGKHLVASGDGNLLQSSAGMPGKNAILDEAGKATGQFLSAAGLKYGFVQGDISGFVEALETLTDTSVIASPNVRVLNKQRAELIIGERLGYKTSTFNGNQTIENINFLEVGTKLLIRPFVSDDGLVRMEIHPERSDGSVNNAGLPSSRTTEVTSNVMVRDGTTIVIGGLIEEQVIQSQSRVPVLGGLPVVGSLFRNKSDDTDRSELVVLITPRIIRDFDAEQEGASVQSEHERRHEDFRERLSPLTRRHFARTEYERASQAFEEGEFNKAKLHIENSLRYNRNDTTSLRLRDQIDGVIAERTGWMRWPTRFRRKPAETYHRVPGSPSMFTEDLLIPSPTSASATPPPPAPAEATFDIPLPATPGNE